MRWLALSSKVNQPRSRFKMNAQAKRRKRKSPPPSSSRSTGGGGVGRFVLAVLVLGGLGGGVWYVLHHSAIFVVREIRVDNNHAYSAEEVIEMTGLETGGNIFTLDPGDARDCLLKNADFRDVSVQRIFPDTIRIDVMEREPRARVQFGHLYTIDNWGVVLGPRKKAPGMQLPVIRGLKVRGGDIFPVDKREACLKLLHELEERNIRSLITIDEIRIFSSDLIEMRTEGDLEITLGQGDYGTQLERLKTVLNKLGPDVARAREVDLRYSKIPVVFDD